MSEVIRHAIKASTEAMWHHKLLTLAGAVLAVSAVMPPSLYEYNGVEPIDQFSNDIISTYPLKTQNFPYVEVPFVLFPKLKESHKSVLTGGSIQTFEAAVDTSGLVYDDAENGDAQSGQVTCKDGSKVPYINMGPISQQALQQAMCDEVSAAPKDKKIAKKTKKAAEKAGDGSCRDFDGGERILCEAQKFEKGDGGIYYGWGMGHVSASKFQKGCPDPSNPPKSPANKPNNGFSNPNNGGLSGNASPCAVDCSSLVSQAVNAAFNQNHNWNVAGIKHAKQWKKIPLKSAKPGDVVTKGSNTHVEVVMYRIEGKTYKTIGAHKTGTRVSDAIGSFYDAAYTYVG